MDARCLIAEITRKGPRIASALRLGFYFIAIAVVCIIYYTRSNMLFYFFDGAWYRDAMRTHAIWGGGIGTLNYDPLRGLFNIFPLNDYNSSPVVFLADHIVDSDKLPAAIFIGYAVLIAAVFSLACKALRIPQVIGALATFVSLAFATPLLWPTAIPPMFILAPTFLESSIAFAFFVLSFALLSPSTPAGRTVALPLVLFAAGWTFYSLLILPLSALLLLPPLLFALVLLTVLSHRKAEFYTKLLVLSAFAIAVLFSRIIDFTINLLRNTSTAFFSSEMPIYDGGFILSSMLYQAGRFPFDCPHAHSVSNSRRQLIEID